MMCVRHVLVFLLLVPFPSAPPLLMFTFAVALFLAVRPCGYCIAMLGLLYLSTHPFSPSVSTTTLFPSLNATAIDPQPDSLFSSAIPDRSWISWNSGRIFDPVLAGYRLIDYKTQSDQTTSTVYRTEGDILELIKQEPVTAARPWYAPRVDMRQFGVGVVLDFGLKRYEGDVREEVRQWRVSNERVKGETLLDRVGLGRIGVRIPWLAGSKSEL